jgi:hypothetical protein
MKSKDIKSLAYAFVSEDINVYFPDNDEECFIVEKLVCADCNSFWHTSLSECYFCGEINYYLSVCNTCGNKYSITNSLKKCTCNDPASLLIKACINRSCITNIDPEIKSFSESEMGVFEKDSSQSVSLMYCLNCGAQENKYLSFKVFVYNDLHETDLRDYILRVKSYFNSDDILILKKHKEIDIINYAIINNLNHDHSYNEIDFPYSSISDLINDIIN